MDIFVNLFVCLFIFLQVESPDFAQAICSLNFLRCSESVVGIGGLCAVLTCNNLVLPLCVVSTLGLSSFKAVDMQIFLPSPRTPTFLFQHCNNSYKISTM